MCSPNSTWWKLAAPSNGVSDNYNIYTRMYNTAIQNVTIWYHHAISCSEKLTWTPVELSSIISSRQSLSHIRPVQSTAFKFSSSLFLYLFISVFLSVPQHIMQIQMQIEPWHAHGTGPKPKFAQIWRLFVYFSIRLPNWQKKTRNKINLNHNPLRERPLFYTDYKNMVLCIGHDLYK